MLLFLQHSVHYLLVHQGIFKVGIKHSVVRADRAVRSCNVRAERRIGPDLGGRHRTLKRPYSSTTCVTTFPPLVLLLRKCLAFPWYNFLVPIRETGRLDFVQAVRFPFASLTGIV
jgi:hypothetical protein